MAYEMKDNSGTLFHNDKATTDKHPSRKGKAKIDGVEYYVSAWTQISKTNNKEYLSLKFERVAQEDVF